MEPHTKPESAELERPRRLGAEWFAVLGGPLAWVLGFALQYGFVEGACGSGNMLPLHLAALLTFAAALASGMVALRLWRQTRRAAAEEEGTPLGRSRFMSHIGVLNAPLFALAIIAQWLANVFLHPCMGI